MIGIGASNIAAGLFQGFPVSTSGSRTAVADQAGAKSQLTGLVGAAVITLMLVAIPGLMQALPQPTLGAVVIVAAWSRRTSPPRCGCGCQRRTDFAIMMVAFLASSRWGISWHRHRRGDVDRERLPSFVVALSRGPRAVDDQPGYHDLERYEVDTFEHASRLHHHPVRRPLIFANANTFSRFVLAQSDRMSEHDPAWIVVAAESITDADTTACDMLEELDATLESAAIG